jgi:hypothetical protein
LIGKAEAEAASLKVLETETKFADEITREEGIEVSLERSRTSRPENNVPLYFGAPLTYLSRQHPTWEVSRCRSMMKKMSNP